MTSLPRLRCDIFCNVIDNFGDIGVCWRLARQLTHEFDLEVRLWVNELQVFAGICPEIDPQQAEQIVLGIAVHQWGSDFRNITPGDIVIEAFACQLPDDFVAAMAQRTPKKPAWINLDYLSAEGWVSGCHALPSPHPRLPITKYFFFPGFDESTGGLLREKDLPSLREQFVASQGEQNAFWSRLKITPPAKDALAISLFAYENQAIVPLLSALTQRGKSICCLAPITRTQALVEAFAGHAVKAGDRIRRGSLEIILLPFMHQDDYDRLLWFCDVNLVRGEDSFVRAQWAAKPLVWHIYPQEDEAHRIKLEAFLDRYCVDLPPQLNTLVRNFFLGWNGLGAFSPALVDEWMENLVVLRQHAEKWEKNLSKQQDLCTSLVRFCKSKL